jgi:hypothetical protein
MWRLRASNVMDPQSSPLPVIAISGIFVRTTVRVGPRRVYKYVRWRVE